ncbi:hypothetical protein ACKS2F_000089 [Cronobacter dublinensis]
MNLSDFKDTLSGVSAYAWMFSVVSIILVLIGWFVTYNNSLKIATRSESKSIIDAIAKILNEISDLSIDYWVNKSVTPNTNPFKKVSVKSTRGLTTPGAKLYLTAIHGKSIQINKYMNFLRNRGFVISDSYFTQVYISATLDYEKSFEYSKSYRVTRAQEVSIASTEFMMHLYDAFQDNHPPKIPVSLIQKLKEFDEKIDVWYQGLYERY